MSPSGGTGASDGWGSGHAGDGRGRTVSSPDKRRPQDLARFSGSLQRELPSTVMRVLVAEDERRVGDAFVLCDQHAHDCRGSLTLQRTTKRAAQGLRAPPTRTRHASALPSPACPEPTRPWPRASSMATSPLPRRLLRPRGGPVRGQAGRRGPGRDARARAGRAAGGRPRPARGRARPGEDAHGQDARPRRWAGPSAACSSRPTWCPPISSAPASGGRTPATSTPSSGRSSATCSWPTRSTARPPRCSRRSWRSCRSARSRSAARPTRFPARSW